MSSVIDLQLTVTLAGVSQAGHLRSCKRTGNLVEIGFGFEIQLDSSATGLGVGQSAVIAENGTTVLTGRVNQVQFRRDPEPMWIVSGRDEFWRATDYYVDDKDLQATGQSITYWIGYLCGLCGLSYVISSSGGTQSVGTFDVPVPLGMMPVVDSLRQLAGGAGWSMRMTAAGVLEFVALVDSGTPDEIFTTINQGNHTKADEQVRNVAKIWGYEAGNASGIIYKQSVAIPGIVPDRIMVVSSPNITTLARAQALAQMLLNHFARIDETSDAVLPVGAPTRILGMRGQMTIEPAQTQLSVVTDLESVVDKSGYVQTVSIGRKNFWLPSWPPASTLVDATFVAAMARNPIAGTCIAVTGDITVASPVWFNHSGGLSGNPIQIALDHIHGSTRAYCLTDNGLYSCSDITNASVNWVHRQTVAQIVTAIQASSPYGGNFYSPPNIFLQIGGICCDSTTIDTIAFQVSAENNDATWEGVFMLVSTDGGATISVAGSGNVIQFPFGADPGLILYGSASFGPFNDQGSSSYIQWDGGVWKLKIGLDYGFGLLGFVTDDSGNDWLNNPTPGQFDTNPIGYHTRGGATANRVLWAPSASGGAGVVYFEQGRIAAGNHTLTPDTGLTHPIGGDGFYYPNAIAVSVDGSYALGLDQSGHAWRNNGGHAWTDMGAIGLGTGARSLMYLFTVSSQLKFVAAGSHTGDPHVMLTTDGGVTWTDKSGNLTALFATNVPDFTSLDYR